MSQVIGGYTRKTRLYNSGRLLAARLDELRRNRLVIAAISAAAWAIATGLSTMLICAWIDLVFALPSAARALSWLVAFGLSGFVIYRLNSAAKRSSDNHKLAGMLDESSGSGGEIRTGIDLTQVARAKGEPTLTNQLAEIAVDKAYRLSHKIESTNVARPESVVTSWLSLCGLLSIAAVVAALVPRMAVAEAKRFFDPFGDHAPYSVYTFDLQLEKTEVLYGDDLEVNATVEGPAIEQLQLVLMPPADARKAAIADTEPLDVLPMFPDAEGGWHVSVAAIKEPFDMFLRIRNDRSDVQSINVITVPEIENVEVEVTQPLYTGQPPMIGGVPQDGIKGLPGTEVTVTVTSNRPLRNGRLQLSQDGENQAITMDVDPGNMQRVTGSFVLTTNGSAEITITDEAGQQSRSPFRIPLKQLKDLSPLVRMLQPRTMSFATPDAALPIAVSAEDDYGIQRCQLFRSLNNSSFLDTDLPMPAGRNHRLQTGTQLPLAKYDLQPGDIIRLFARVEDNDPLSPHAPVGKGAESRIVTVQIISQDEFEQAQVRRAGMQEMMNRFQQAKRRLERLASEMQDLQKQLAEADPDSDVAKELQEKMKKLAEQMKKDADALEELSKRPLPIEIDETLSPQLKEMAERLRKAAEQMQQTAGQKQSNKQAAEQMQKQLDALKQEQKRHQEQAMQPLERMQQILPLKQAEGEFMQLVQRQRDIADRLSSLKESANADDPETRARLREFEDQQNAVRKQLTDLLDRIEEQANGLPDDDEELAELKQTALEFASAVRSSEADSEMIAAEQALNEFTASQGHKRADKAAEILESFISQCKGMGGKCNGACKPKFNPSLSQCMSNSLSQLAGTGQQQGGTGMGAAGQGGNSSQMSNSANVGMYGGVPTFNQTTSGMGESESDNVGGVFRDPYAEGEDGGASGFNAGQTNSVFGGGSWGVPAQYRRQAGRYLQQLAEELDE